MYSDNCHVICNAQTMHHASFLSTNFSRHLSKCIIIERKNPIPCVNIRKHTLVAVRDWIQCHILDEIITGVAPFPFPCINCSTPPLPLVPGIPKKLRTRLNCFRDLCKKVKLLISTDRSKKNTNLVNTLASGPLVWLEQESNMWQPIRGQDGHIFVD